MISEELLMNATQWSSNLVLAWLMWVVGSGVILFDLFVASADDIGHVGIGLILGGKIFYDRELVVSIKSREKAAFDLGRESIRSLR